MKTPVLYIMILFFMAACSSSRNSASGGQMKIVEASFYNWSTGSPGDPGTLERGTDIEIIIAGWPDDFIPKAAIFNNRKSFPAELEKGENNRVIITARIIYESMVLAEISEHNSQSDRLIFTKNTGEKSYIEISNWNQMPDRYN